MRLIPGLPKEVAPGEWAVAKVALPPAGSETVGEVRADERPSTPDDPRTPAARNAGFYGGA